MNYYSSNGFHERTVEPYKLLFKEEGWYLYGYCYYRNDFRVFKINRITCLQVDTKTFLERDGHNALLLKSSFSNETGIEVSVRMDKTLEFLAIDFFGIENIREEGDNLFITF